MFKSASILAVLATAICASASAQTNLSNFWGGSAQQHLGTAIDRIGDVNGDGYADMIVGSPGAGVGGAIYFVSGYYLKTGNGFASLGATFGTTTGGGFGTSVISLADVTGDGIADALVGEMTTGYVRLVSGATRTIVASYSITTSDEMTLARTGDVDGDGYSDAFVGQADQAPLSGFMWVVSPRKMSLGVNPILKTQDGFEPGFATSVSAGDVDNNGTIDYVEGNPVDNSIKVFATVQNVYQEVRGATGSQFGRSIDASRDFNGDGYCDIVVGASDSSTVYMLSGAAIMSGPSTQPVAAVTLTTWTNGQSGSGFGFCVATTPDMNADGVADILVGAPSYDSLLPIANDRGAINMISGRTLLQMGFSLGVSGEQLGYCVSRGWDYDGDGRTDIAAGAPFSDQGANDAGIMRIYSLFPATPKTYCAAKVNSLGCTPVIGFGGASPSLSSPSAFNVTAINLINNKPGLLIYALNADAASFQGGTLCLKSPIKRVGTQNTLGSPPPNNCSGHMTYDFNARIQSGADPALLLLGQEVFCQYWSRDPGDAFGSSLSNALHFVVNP